MTADDRPLSDEASLTERYPRKSQPATDDPLRDVWAHIFNAITATNITRPDEARWLFSTRLDASERVWGVVEPLLREVVQGDPIDAELQLPEAKVIRRYVAVADTEEDADDR